MDHQNYKTTNREPKKMSRITDNILTKIRATLKTIKAEKVIEVLLRQMGEFEELHAGEDICVSAIFAMALEGKLNGEQRLQFAMRKPQGSFLALVEELARQEHMEPTLNHFSVISILSEFHQNKLLSAKAMSWHVVFTEAALGDTKDMVMTVSAPPMAFHKMLLTAKSCDELTDIYDLFKGKAYRRPTLVTTRQRYGLRGEMAVSTGLYLPEGVDEWEDLSEMEMFELALEKDVDPSDSIKGWILLGLQLSLVSGITAGFSERLRSWVTSKGINAKNFSGLL